MRSLARASKRSAVPARSVFFGKITNSSLELVYRSIFRLEHVKRAIAYGHAGTYGTPWRHSSLPTHDGAAELALQYKESGEKLGLAPLPMYSDPHRVLRLYACLANPVLDHHGHQEVHYGGQSFGLSHGAGGHGHGHGEHKGFFARLAEQRALRKQHTSEDGSLARGHAYEVEQPTWYDLDRPVWWCEHYKVTVPYMQAELCIFLARTLLRTLGYEPTPQAADQLIDELYDDVDTKLLEQWREGHVNTFPTKTFFLQPATTYQTTEDMQHFMTPSLIWGGPYGSQAKWLGYGTKKDWKWEVERFKPENVLVRDPREGQLKGNFENPAH